MVLWRMKESLTAVVNLSTISAIIPFLGLLLFVIFRVCCLQFSVCISKILFLFVHCNIGLAFDFGVLDFCQIFNSGGVLTNWSCFVCLLCVYYVKFN